MFSTEKRNQSVIKQILSFCSQIEEARRHFNFDAEMFRSCSTYSNAVSFCIFQIGELANGLSEEFRSTHGDIPWHQVRGMRNIIAHQYGTTDIDRLWNVATTDIPMLKNFCDKIINAIGINKLQGTPMMRGKSPAKDRADIGICD